MDQPTDVYLPPLLRPFPYHSPDMIPTSLAVHNNGSDHRSVADDVGTNLIQSQEEVGGDFDGGRHEIVIGSSVPSISMSLFTSPHP